MQNVSIMMSPSAYGEIVHRLQNITGKTLEDLGAELDASRQTLSNWINNVSIPNHQHRLRLQEMAKLYSLYPIGNLLDISKLSNEDRHIIKRIYESLLKKQ